MELNFDLLNRLEKTPSGVQTDITVYPDAQTATASTPAPEKAPDLSSLVGHTENAPGINLNAGGQGGGEAKGNKSGSSFSGGGKTTFTASQLIPASLGVDLADLIVPTLLVIILDRATGKRYDKGLFSATPEEKQMIEPVLKTWMDTVNIDNLTPFQALLVVLGCVYGMKTVEIMAGVKLPNKPKMSVVRAATDHSNSHTSNRQNGHGNLSPAKDKPYGSKTEDMNAYQREYQRRWRAQNKKKKTVA